MHVWSVMLIGIKGFLDLVMSLLTYPVIVTDSFSIAMKDIFAFAFCAFLIRKTVGIGLGKKGNN